MRLRDLVLDPWTPLSHKQPFDKPGGVPNRQSWLSAQDQRRLLAYTLLKAYQSNVARAFLHDDGSDEPDERREYGDPLLIVQQTVASILGSDQTIVVEGAEDEVRLDLDDPDDPETDEVETEAEESPEAAAARERQEWLRQWAADERLPLKLLEGEHNAVGLGDAVFLLAWDAKKKRPRLTVIDPGFYFPVLPEGLSDDYPGRVHLCWVIPGDPENGRKDRLRRVTYELGPIQPAREEFQTSAGRLRRLVPFLDVEAPPLLPGDRRDADGTIRRRYPWQPEDEDDSTVTCFLSEAEWVLDDATGGDADALDESKAVYLRNDEGELLDRLDLRVDFVPVLHVPNTVAGSEHYGQSTLLNVLQALDELSSSDTDESAASATTGNPPIGLSGVGMAKNPDGSPVRMTMGPGEVWGLGENGRMSTVDTSPALAALAERISRLQERVSRNSRLPASILGMESQNSPSGYHLRLTFGPLENMVREARLVRGEKYPLLLKFVQRLAMAGQVLEGGPTMPADIALGPFLPTDVDQLVEQVRGLFDARLISLETAVRMLQEGGLPIENVRDEVRRIQSRDVETANGLADAVNDQAIVRRYLGLGPAPEVQAVPAGAAGLPPGPPDNPFLPPAAQ